MPRKSRKKMQPANKSRKTVVARSDIQPVQSAPQNRSVTPASTGQTAKVGQSNPTAEQVLATNKYPFVTSEIKRISILGSSIIILIIILSLFLPRLFF